MKWVSFLAAAIFTISLSSIPAASVYADTLFQSDSRDRFGEKDFAYFFIEAEDFHDNDPRLLGASWLLSSDPASLAQTVNNDLEPDPGAFASGDGSITNAMFQSTVTNEEGGGHDVQYIVSFDTPGTYYLYIRQHSPLGFENDRNKNDSFYVPVEFGESPRQLKANGDDYGILESIALPGDTFTRGPWLWFAARSFVENSEQNPPIDQNPASFLEWIITEDMVDTDLILEFDHRETGAMLDAFLFIETTSELPPTNGAGPDGLGFFGPEDAVDIEFGLKNLGSEVECPAPEITGINPTEGEAGDEITITGENLDCEAGVSVIICDIEAQIVESDETTITVVVPECVDSGPVDVTVLHEGFESETDPDGFTYSAGISFIRADGNNDGQVNISDASFLLNWLFLGGPDLQCQAAGDANSDGAVNISDSSYLLNWLFLGGPDIGAPFPNCGPQQEGETLECAESTCN